MDSEEEKQPIVVIKIDHINIFGEPQYMRVSTDIHDDRTHFDINVKLIRELGSNFLFLNVRLRVKAQGADHFVRMVEWKRLDFCGFLTEYNTNEVMRFMFRKSVQWKEIIGCPVRIGNYTIHSINVADSMYPANLQSGIYKFFVEVVEGNGEIAKVFAMQVTTMVNVTQE
ncbi:uncharacterized protein Dwil_GK27460 [Drosophila willistoni]|uniref:Uncharacterized protein n=1 Tax=Drosophila willistoni TaxID=7260 RepID=A0A0Q9WTH6_DROWI|nr:uncharacterized protein LOC26529462 [Drosophila willistoni]KRF99514.1 uncharacterized protein Dwil_GK27460 [Drosophila willistoni]